MLPRTVARLFESVCYICKWMHIFAFMLLFLDIYHSTSLQESQRENNVPLIELHLCYIPRRSLT